MRRERGGAGVIWVIEDHPYKFELVKRLIIWVIARSRRAAK